MKKLLYLLVLGLFLAPLHSASAATFNIANGDVSGLSTAINTANSNGESNTINLATSGTYTLSNPDSTLSFLPMITSNITIEGNGASIVRDNAASNYRLILIERGPNGSKLTLNNITISNSQGGAILSENSDVELNNSIFSDNVSNGASAVKVTNGNLTVTNSNFSNNSFTQLEANTLNWGGAIAVSPGNMTITNSTFIGNSSGRGGAIFFCNGTATISGSTFDNNRGTGTNIYASGAISSCGQTSISNSVFTSNSSEANTEVIENYHNLNVTDGNMTISNSSFSGNTASGVFDTGTSLTVQDSMFQNNSAVIAPAIFHGSGTLNIIRTRILHNTATSYTGAVLFVSDNGVGSMNISDSEITGNSAPYAGAIALYDLGGSVSVSNTKILDNLATSGSGGALYFLSHSVPIGIRQIENNCIVGNSNTSVQNDNPDVYDLTNNWWGAPDGPSGVGPGTGDSVSTNITFSSFLTSPPPSCPYSANVTPTPTPTPSPTPTPTPTPVQIKSLSSANVWVGLKNSDDVGIKFDFKAEAYKNTTLVSSGELDSFGGGSSGFNNAHLATIPFNTFSPVDFPQGSQLKLTLSVRNACTGSAHNSGTARLWYNDSVANSQFDTTIGSIDSTYFLLDNFILGTSPGSIKKTIDVASGAKCSAFKPFGTWTITP